MQRYILCRLQRLKLPWRCLRKFRNWNATHSGSDCKKYVQHYMLRYSEPECVAFQLRSAPLVALRGAPVSTGRAAKGRVGQSIARACG